VAVALSQAIGADVVSFDSRQVYRGIEVSSNAPSEAELEGVVVHLVGRLEPTEGLTAARYVDLAREAVARVPRQRRVVHTAGTGMYLKAYLEGLDLGGMGAVPGLRAQLEAEAAADLPALAGRLRGLSPELAARTDLRNPARVVRRLELLWAAALASGGTASGAASSRIEALKVGLRVPVAELESRIARRVERMLDQGWRAEVEALLDLDPPPAGQVLKSIGVAEMAAHIRGEIDLDGLREAVVLRTRQYAKRQRTWFRGDPEVRWLEAGDRATSDIVAGILEMLA
jgi:tRNA dimethylallyltransferase